MWSIGTTFTHAATRDIIFTITAGKDDNNFLIRWPNDDGGTPYTREQVNEYIGDGTWRIVSQPEPIIEAPKGKIRGYIYKDEKWIKPALLAVQPNTPVGTTIDVWKRKIQEEGVCFQNNSWYSDTFKRHGLLDLWFTPVYEEIVIPTLNYEVGDYLYCTKDMYMEPEEDEDNPEHAYTVDQVYLSEQKACITDNSDCKSHEMDPELTAQHFRKATAEEIRIKRQFPCPPGTIVYCTKDFYMVGSKTDRRFTAGNLYTREEEEKFLDDNGEFHTIHSRVLYEHFRPATHDEMYYTVKTPIEYHKGDKLYCRADFVMSDGSTAYTRGRVYECDSPVSIIDNKGNDHYMGNDLGHFFRTPTEKEMPPAVPTVILGSNKVKVELHKGEARVDGKRYKLVEIRKIYDQFIGQRTLGAYGAGLDQRMQCIRIGCEAEDHRFSLKELQQILIGIQ